MAAFTRGSGSPDRTRGLLAVRPAEGTSLVRAVASLATAAVQLVLIDAHRLVPSSRRRSPSRPLNAECGLVGCGRPRAACEGPLSRRDDRDQPREGAAARVERPIRTFASSLRLRGAQGRRGSASWNSRARARCGDAGAQASDRLWRQTGPQDRPQEFARAA
jgi:hypothetical protein